MNLFLIIDISGSMTGHKIGAVTDAMENLLSELSEEDINVAVMFFSRTTKWMMPELTPINDMKWEEPECNGMTSMGLACKELASKLKSLNVESQNAFLLLSDGCPTDDFEEGLNELLEVSSFANGHRRAIAIGNDADVSSLTKFTGNPQHVVKVEDLDYLLQAIMTLINIEDFNNPKEEKSQNASRTNSQASIIEDDEWA